jgi:hypothetical protein
MQSPAGSSTPKTHDALTGKVRASERDPQSSVEKGTLLLRIQKFSRRPLSRRSV